jgi:DNA primase
MTDLKKVLMERDGLSFEEADKVIADMRKQVFNGANPEELLYEIGLEPDYIFDII